MTTWRAYAYIAGRWRPLGAFRTQAQAYAVLTPRPAGAVAWAIKVPGQP